MAELGYRGPTQFVLPAQFVGKSDLEYKLEYLSPLPPIALQSPLRKTIFFRLGSSAGLTSTLRGFFITCTLPLPLPPPPIHFRLSPIASTLK